MDLEMTLMAPGDHNVLSVDHRWSTILPELLVAILKRLERAPDRIRVGWVCSWWRSVLAESGHLLPPSAPMLLFPYNEEVNYFGCDGHGTIHRVVLADLHKYVEGYCGWTKKLIYGSSMGWLFTADRGRGEDRLWNPVTGAEIPLPSISTFSKRSGFIYESYFCLKKAVLSTKPSKSITGDSSCAVAMVIRRCREMLIFCRIGDERWTTFPAGGVGPASFDDVICYRSQFYAVTSGGGGQVVLCDVGPNPKLSVLSMPPTLSPMDGGFVDDEHCIYTYYLVESTSGELLKVKRVLTRSFSSLGVFCTSRFVVYKLDVAEAASTTEMTNLGDQALFLGSSSSTSYTASQVRWCERNCIYFLDDLGSRRGDMGVFNLEKRSIARFACPFMSYAPKFWIGLDPW